MYVCILFTLCMCVCVCMYVVCICMCAIPNIYVLNNIYNEYVCIYMYEYVYIGASEQGGRGVSDPPIKKYGGG